MALTSSARNRLISLAREDRYERMIQFVQAWCKATGRYSGTKGGWIRNAAGDPVAQGWYAFSRRPYIQDDALDWATRDLTAFKDFEDMLATHESYRPTMRVDCDWRFMVLAEEFNARMRMRGEERRAYTPNMTITDSGMVVLGPELGWDTRVLLDGEVPRDWCSFVGNRPLDARIETMTRWLLANMTGRFAVMPLHAHDLHRVEREKALARMRGVEATVRAPLRSDTEVIVAFEDDRDAVMFRLMAENSPWGADAVALRPLSGVGSSTS